MTDLSSFGVQNGFYSKNVAFVPTAPASAFSSPPSPSSTPEPWKLQVLYPSGSINPAGRIKGGAEFYADPFTPGTLASARRVRLAYRVLFPAGFNFVRGGKLPGLFGGHAGCSGGAAAADCFSTRLMWRTAGAGELYLYAPRDAQGPSVCRTPPKSVCSADYGLSVGRGAFTFARGAWTAVSQTVGLNTPGSPDGTFVLEVDGKEVMRVEDVLYRAAPPGFKAHGADDNGADDGGGGGNDDGDGDGDGDADDSGTSDGAGAASGDDGLGELLGGVLRRDASVGADPVLIALAAGARGFAIGFTPDGQVVLRAPPDAASDAVAAALAAGAPIAVAFGSDGTAALDAPSAPAEESEPALQGAQARPAPATGVTGFLGLHFSTFFGGHDQEWASPRDQYVWFDGFEIDVLE
jgi:hypothetical protein